MAPEDIQPAAVTADPALLGTMAACTALAIMARPCEVDAAKCKRRGGRALPGT